MEELKKINRIIDKEYPEAYRETLVVLDGTTGQNALVQARQFMETADITGIILTKLDGTAKGGIAVAIQSGDPGEIRGRRREDRRSAEI